ncbi:hypothetical protein N9901_00430 [Flavobacteriaceae bacterium]|nr:hypothetical protein [Flavobacteriaceae bacterium]
MFKEIISKIDTKLVIRFCYYLGGMAIGAVALTFINKQKGTTFNYGFNSRVLSQIRLRDTLKVSNEAQTTLNTYHLDSLDVQYVLHKGEWDRDKSHPHGTPCPDFWIDATIGKKVDNEIKRIPVSFIVERCEYTATIKEVKINN